MPRVKGYQSAHSKSIDDYLTATYSTHTPQQQALELNLSYQAVIRRRSRLLKLGILRPSQRATRRAWTTNDEALVREMLHAGSTIDAIARQINRSSMSVRSWMEDHNISVAEIRANGIRTFTTNQAATVLGIHPETLRRWIVCGWGPKYSRLRRRRGSFRLIYEMDLLDWLENPVYWMLWTPESITDPVLHEAALEYRSRLNGCWLSASEAATQLSYCRASIWQWITTGHLPALRLPGAHTYYIWSTDLKCFIPPTGVAEALQNPPIVRPPSIITLQ